MAAGPLIGGLVVNILGWRWMFWMNVLVGLVAVALTFQLGPSLRPVKLRLDIFGQITATIAIGCLVFIFIEGPHLGWNAPPLLLTAALCVAAIVSFVIGERRTPHPLIPPRLAARAEFIGSAILGALFNFSFYGVLFVLSLLLQDVKGESALRAGLGFLPLTGLIFVGNLIAPRISRRTSTNIVLYLGQALFAGGLLLTIFTAPLAQSWPLAFSLLPMGFGAGLLVPTMTARMLESLPQDLTGAASGSFNTCRQLGGAIGVAFFGTLLGSSSPINTGFTTCLTVSLVCIAVSSVLTLTLLGGTRRHAKQVSN
jgi:DHA2 family methylenomycin A resistance protein-like MFS transporter